MESVSSLAGFSVLALSCLALSCVLLVMSFLVTSRNHPQTNHRAYLFERESFHKGKTMARKMYDNMADECMPDLFLGRTAFTQERQGPEKYIYMTDRFHAGKTRSREICIIPLKSGTLFLYGPLSRRKDEVQKDIISSQLPLFGRDHFHERKTRSRENISPAICFWNGPLSHMKDKVWKNVGRRRQAAPHGELVFLKMKAQTPTVASILMASPHFKNEGTDATAGSIVMATTNFSK